MTKKWATRVVATMTKLGAGCGLAALLAATPGCKDDVNPAVTACHDYVDAWATRASECGFDYKAQQTQLEAVLSCGTFTAIRDRMSFYDQCFPWIESLTCAQLNDKNLVADPSCTGQLLR